MSLCAPRTCGCAIQSTTLTISGSGSAESPYVIETGAVSGIDGLTVAEDGAVIDATVTTFNFGSAFDIVESPENTVNVTIDLSEYAGNDLPLSAGGTGASLSDPGADRIGFWDDSAGQFTWLTVGSGLAITGTTLAASGGSSAVLNGGGISTIQSISQSAYDALVTPDANTLYVIV
jgi:hypothetical protein